MSTNLEQSQIISRLCGRIDADRKPSKVEAMNLRVEAAKAICGRGYSPAETFDILGWGSAGAYVEEYNCLCDWYMDGMKAECGVRSLAGRPLDR